ncbi:hypothetical protein GINT2_000045 [Glugoides intestinalis]
MDIESMILKKIAKTIEKCDIHPVKHEKAAYFHVKASDKQAFVNGRLLQMKPHFAEALDIPEFKPINFQSLKPFYCFGIITTPTGTKLSKDNVYLFNTIDNSNVPVKVDLSALDSYSLFNGQIVTIKGTNSRGDTILAECIHTVSNLCEYKMDMHDVNAVFCKGPFSKESLESIFSMDSNPVVLLGPFCNSDDATFPKFQDFIDFLEALASKFFKTKVILIPSLDDYCAVRIFPQPPIRLSNDRIVSMANPAHFFLNERLIVVCNFDNFIDLCFEEISKYPEASSSDVTFIKDRIGRLSTHLVFQQCFVPALCSKSDVAYGPWLHMNHAPDLYVISSKMKHFDREIGPVSLLNVGSTAKVCFKVTKSGYKGKYEIDRIQL